MAVWLNLPGFRTGGTWSMGIYCTVPLTVPCVYIYAWKCILKSTTERLHVLNVIFQSRIYKAKPLTIGPVSLIETNVSTIFIQEANKIFLLLIWNWKNLCMYWSVGFTGCKAYLESCRLFLCVCSLLLVLSALVPMYTHEDYQTTVRCMKCFSKGCPFQNLWAIR